MVRYIDSPTTSVTTTIEAPPEDVWPLVADISLPARFSQEFQGAEWVEGSEEIGARFRGRNDHPIAGSWSTVCTVTEWSPPTSFAYLVENPDDPTARWRFDLEPVDGGTRLTMTAVMGPGPSGVLSLIRKLPDKEEKIIANRLAEWTDNMQRTVDGIRSLVLSDDG
ncbi:MAG: SRPBCC family protein [Acidimicrobiia bacterium]|nr:SRPBCC family protein [Acidimicrobiia bacterium]